MKLKEESEKSWLKTQHSKDEDRGAASHGGHGSVRQRRRRRRVLEDVGHARAGHGAGSEHAAGQPGAAAG